MGHVTLHSVLAWGKKKCCKEGCLGQLAKFKHQLWISNTIITSVLGVLLLVTT